MPGRMHVCMVWCVMVVGCLGFGAEDALALTMYQAKGFGQVTILSWTDESTLVSFDPKPADLAVNQDRVVHIDQEIPTTGLNQASFEFDAAAGDVDSFFSLGAQTEGSIDRSINRFAFSDWLGEAKIIILNPDPEAYLVNIQLDWQLEAQTQTDAAGSEFGFAAASVELSAYTGKIFSEFVVSSTQNGDGLVQRSGRETFTVRIPAQATDEIVIAVEAFGVAQAISSPEPLSMAMGVFGLGAVTVATRRRPAW